MALICFIRIREIEMASPRNFLDRGAMPRRGGRIIVQREQSCESFRHHHEKESAIMKRIGKRLVGAAVLAALFGSVALAIADEISFKKRGMGLGLSFVLAILEHHHARLEIDSEPLRGTTFRIRFPAATGAVVAPGPNGATSEEPSA